MSNIIVLALGGNALGNDPQEQKEAVKHTSKSIVDLIEAGNQVILSHGNGPQVGMINLAMDAASKSEAGTPEMPFPECGAMSQGYIGYHLQNAIQNELIRLMELILITSSSSNKMVTSSFFLSLLNSVALPSCNTSTSFPISNVSLSSSSS
jgi:carbamate kinase